MLPEYMTRERIRRFAERVEVSPDGCWNWTGPIVKGYGFLSFRHNRKNMTIRAHTFSALLCIPYDQTRLQRHHLCYNPRCVNPSHLTLLPESQHKSHHKGWNLHDYWKNKTHCPKGHPYTETNTYVNTKGSRACKACRYLEKVYRLRRKFPDKKHTVTVEQIEERLKGGL